MSKPNNPSILVVGATGTVGSALVAALTSRGEAVKAATRDPSRPTTPGVQAVRYDFDDPSTFDAALEGVDRVFYLSRPADPTAAEVARPLFEKAAAAGVRHIVNMSAMGADADESGSLRKVERLLESSELPHTLLRPNWFMQNVSTGNFSGMIREQSALYLPAGDAPVSFVDVRDIAEVAAEILTSGGHVGATLTLTGPQAASFAELTQMISRTAGRPITYTPISDQDFAAALEAQGTPDYAIRFMLRLFGALRAGYNAPVSQDVSTVLGREARDLSAFVQDAAPSFTAAG